MCFLFSPFLWDIESQSFENVLVVWLQVVPISESERLYAVENGPEALDRLFDEYQIDVFNVYRKSVV